jgi:hypothetical protein
MTDSDLLAGLSKLGLPLFEPAVDLDVYETLAKVVKSQDARLWEGYPVLLANATDNYQFEIERVQKLLMGNKEKQLFHQLLLMSGALFSYYHLSFPWWNTLKKDLSKKDKALLNQFKDNLANDFVLELNDEALDPERLKSLFELYFEEKVEKDRRRKERYEEFSLEYALSQIFSPKQKELFKKRLDGLSLTKTEQEYYSRTVKKKVVALANAELHSLSKKLLGL